MDRLNSWRTGSALALAAGTASLICALAIFLFQDGMISFVNAWFHGLGLTILRSDKPWILGGLAYGLFGATLTGFLNGALFACSYNLVSKYNVSQSH